MVKGRVHECIRNYVYYILVIGEKQWMWTNMVSWLHQTLMSEEIGYKVIAIFDAWLVVAKPNTVHSFLHLCLVSWMALYCCHAFSYCPAFPHFQLILNPIIKPFILSLSHLHYVRNQLGKINKGSLCLWYT